MYGQWLMIWLDSHGLKRIRMGKLIMRMSGEEVYVWTFGREQTVKVFVFCVDAHKRASVQRRPFIIRWKK